MSQYISGALDSIGTGFNQFRDNPLVPSYKETCNHCAVGLFAGFVIRAESPRALGVFTALNFAITHIASTKLLEILKTRYPNNVFKRNQYHLAGQTVVTIFVPIVTGIAFSRMGMAMPGPLSLLGISSLANKINYLLNNSIITGF